MLKTKCPACDADLNCPDKLAGKKIGCPKCGEPFRALEATKLLPPKKSLVPAKPPQKIEMPAPTPFRDLDDGRDIPKEPWYYGYVDGYAGLLQWIGWITFGLVALMVTGGCAFVGLFTLPLGLLMIVPWAFLMLVSFAYLLLYLVGIAALRMFVDTCRNVRATRYGV